MSASIFILFVVKYQGVNAHFHRASHLIPDLTLFIYHALSPQQSILIPYIPPLRCDLPSSPACYCCYAQCLSRQQLPMDPVYNPVPRKLSDRISRTRLTHSELIPNRYIVEFDTAASLKASNMKRSGTVSHPLLPKGQD